MHSLNAWVALFQLFISLILSPIAYASQGGDDDAPTNIIKNFGQGFECWLLGTNNLASDHCEHAFWMISLHVLVLVLLNITALIIIIRGSAVIFFLASAIAIPLTVILSSVNFIADDFYIKHGDIQWYDILSVVLVLLGMAIYKHKDEQGLLPLKTST